MFLELIKKKTMLTILKLLKIISLEKKKQLFVLKKSYSKKNVY